MEMILYACGKIVIKGEKKVRIGWQGQRGRVSEGVHMSSLSHVDKVKRRKKKRYYFEIMENREEGRIQSYTSCGLTEK